MEHLQTATHIDSAGGKSHLKLIELGISWACIASGTLSGIALTLFWVINEVTVPPVMNTPQANCQPNEKNLSSLSIWYAISKGDSRMDALANKSTIVYYEITLPSRFLVGHIFPQRFFIRLSVQRAKCNLAPLCVGGFVTARGRTYCSTMHLMMIIVWVFDM